MDSASEASNGSGTLRYMLNKVSRLASLNDVRLISILTERAYNRQTVLLRDWIRKRSKNSNCTEYGHFQEE